jgi:hypothetical protein
MLTDVLIFTRNFTVSVPMTQAATPRAGLPKQGV